MTFLSPGHSPLPSLCLGLSLASSLISSKIGNKLEKVWESAWREEVSFNTASSLLSILLSKWPFTIVNQETDLPIFTSFHRITLEVRTSFVIHVSTHSHTKWEHESYIKNGVQRWGESNPRVPHHFVLHCPGPFLPNWLTYTFLPLCVILLPGLGWKKSVPGDTA